MGGAFIALGDDASSLYVNPAGMILTPVPALYAEYAESSIPGESIEKKVDVLVPLRAAVLGAGWYRLGYEGGSVEDLFIAGFSARILDGVQGSFLSIGSSVKAARFSNETDCGCLSGRSSDTGVTFDAGLIIRPLPVISFGYTAQNLRRIELEVGEDPAIARRIHRWGITYFWEERVAVSFEQEHAPGSVVRHYGFSVRTSTPLELMAGFSEEHVSGGARWNHALFRLTAAFTSCEQHGIEARAALELFFRRAGEGDMK